MPSLIRKDRVFLSLACTVCAAFAALPGARAADLSLNGNTFSVSSGVWDYGTMSISGNGAFFLSSPGVVSAVRYLIGDQSIGSFYLNSGVATGDTMDIGRGGTTYVSGGILQLSSYMTVGSPGSGTLVVTSGTVRAPTMYVGSYNTRGIVAQSGGVVEVTGTLSIGNSSAASSYGLSGGLLTSPTVELGRGSSYAELFVNGGTVSTGQITKTSGNGILTLGGGRIIATGSNASFISTGVTIQLIDGASTVFDTNGKTIGIQSRITRHPALTTSDGGITVTGGGTLTLSATNTYSGQTQVQGATTLRLTGADALRESTLNVTSGTVQFTGHTSGTFGGLAGTQGIALANDLGQAYTLNVGRNHESTTFSGVLSGSGSLVKTGTGALTLAGANTYTGGTVVNSGTLVLAGTPVSGTGIIRGNLTVTNATVQADSVNALGTAASAKVNTVTITSGSLISNAAGDQGWGVAYTLNNALLSSNGGVSSGTTASKFAFGGFSGTKTSVTVNSGTSTIAGRVELRGDNGNTGGTDFTVAGGATLLATAAFTSTNGVTGINKRGAGTMVLSGSNAHTGGTMIYGGTLTAKNNSAMGSGAVTVNAGGVFLVDEGFTIANDIVLLGGEYQHRLTGSLAHAADSTSDLGGVDTHASLLAGTTAGTTLITSFSATSAAANDIFRRSDVYHFAGTDDAAFAMELSFTSTEDNLYLGWLSNGQWINAVEGNTGNNATAPMLNYQGSFAEFQAQYGADLSSYMGAYGVDVNGGVTSVWAVLDHNSDFAAIPEPGTAGLLVLGVLVGLHRRRQA